MSEPWVVTLWKDPYYSIHSKMQSLASERLRAAALVDQLDISNHVYRLDPNGLEEEL